MNETNVYSLSSISSGNLMDIEISIALLDNYNQILESTSSELKLIIISSIFYFLISFLSIYLIDPENNVTFAPLDYFYTFEEELKFFSYGFIIK